MQQIVQMKVEQLIVQFLYKNKKLRLQSIGEFVFISESSVSSIGEYSYFFPEDSIKFSYNPNCSQDEDLISYIMSQTGKIRPLASSDLDSYIVLSKQFLNIGKPLFLNGLGSLYKNQNNEYEFKQGEAVAIKLDKLSSIKSEQNPTDTVISFASPTRRKSPKRFLLPISITLLFLILIFLIYHLITKENKNNNTIIPTTIDSIAYKDSINAILNSNKTNVIKNNKHNNHSDSITNVGNDTSTSAQQIESNQSTDSSEKQQP